MMSCLARGPSKPVARGPLLDKMEELPRAWHSQWGLQLLVRVDKNFNLQTINLSSQQLLGAVGMSWLPCPWSRGGPSEHSLLRNKYNSQKQFAFRSVCLAATRTATDSLAADNAID